MPEPVDDYYIYPSLIVRTEDMSRFRRFAVKYNHPDSASAFKSLLDIAEMEWKKRHDDD